MKQLLRILLSLAAASGSVYGQAPASQKGLAAAEPFRIERGTSFTASAPRGTGGQGAAAERIRILDDIQEAEAILRERYVDGQKLDPSGLTRSAVTSMLHSLDPHSNYFTRDQWKVMLDEQKSGYAGVGMSFAEYARGDASGMFVLSTIPGTSADRAGLRFGDRIVSVNGISVDGKPSAEIRSMVRGTVGTTVNVGVEKADSLRVRSVDLVRSIIPQPSVPDAYMIRPGVGFLDLTVGFNYTTNDEVTAALRKLHRSGMTSLIIDLRGNGGGIVDQAVKVAEKFMPAGELIVSQQGRNDSREWRSSNLSPETMPLVLLVDENTASASEIVAGALQDTDRALIVGEKTFGKGLVQDVIDLPGNTGLTLTAARYFTPTGRSIQRDYSEIGRYEYFSHHVPAADIDKPYFEARTITGRKVLGGDGIAPDEHVGSVEPRPVEINVLDAIFYFSREFSAGRISGLSPVRPRTPAAGEHINLRHFPSKESLFAAFKSFLRTHNSWNLDDKTLARESGFIGLRLRQSIATGAFGSIAAGQVVTEVDPFIVRGLEILPRSGQLAQKAAKLRQIK